ncbi:MAG TPA: D-alanyl-D-alanine carboxypeptidase/D-alanyl-D-alanine-endopeptidase [Bacteroidetes bacterium]|nr:D-alanyl-D-alanine carboxypeptidase/D-alanyl-D-alanine-endopeptidase [Bacteroidota bacterium]
MRPTFLFFSLLVTVNLIFTAGECFGQSEKLPQTIHSRIEKTAREIRTDPLLQHGQWSCTVLDIAAEKPLLKINSEKSMAPASNLKLFTSAAALTYFGKDYRFSTRVGYSGEISNGVLSGNLVIVGGGDPTLGSVMVKKVAGYQQILQKFAGAVRQAGIRKINGKIIVGVSFFDPFAIPDGWLWVDIGNYYGAGPSAFCFHDNLYYLYFKPAKFVSGPAAVVGTEPKIPGLVFRNFMKTGPVGSGDHGYIYGGAGGNIRILRGTIPAGVKKFSIKGSVPNPALLFVRLLRQQILQLGIEVAGKDSISREAVHFDKEIFHHQSPPLSEIIYWLNKKSINLYAEVLLKHLGAAEFKIGNFASGLKALKMFLTKQGISLDGSNLIDGSGLSPQNRITTMQMARLLKKMAQGAYFKEFYRSLPIAGSRSDDGNLAYFCRRSAAANNVRVKTGFIDRVRAHSGYVKTKSGKLLCFSMIANDFPGAMRGIDKLHEKLLIALAEMR